jgi:hypothetical protein
MPPMHPVMRNDCLLSVLSDSNIFERRSTMKLNLVNQDSYASGMSSYLADWATESWTLFLYNMLQSWAGNKRKKNVVKILLPRKQQLRRKRITGRVNGEGSNDVFVQCSVFFASLSSIMCALRIKALIVISLLLWVFLTQPTVPMDFTRMTLETTENVIGRDTT